MQCRMHLSASDLHYLAEIILCHIYIYGFTWNSARINRRKTNGIKHISFLFWCRKQHVIIILIIFIICISVQIYIYIFYYSYLQMNIVSVTIAQWLLIPKIALPGLARNSPFRSIAKEVILGLNYLSASNVLLSITITTPSHKML